MRVAVARGLLLSMVLAGCDHPRPARPQATAAARQAEALPSTTPQEAWEARKAALLAADAPAVWNSLCAASRSAKIAEQTKAMEEMNRLPYDSLVQALKPYGLTPGQFRKMDSTQFCLHMIRFGAAQPGPGRKRLEEQRFVRAEVAEGLAMCLTSFPDGTASVAVFVAEGGAWKLDDAETARRNGRPPQK